MKRVHPGDEVALSASAYNAWCDAAEDLQTRRMSQTGNARPERRYPDVVLVRNDSGADVCRFGILGIDGPIIAPADNLDEFKGRVAIKGALPTSAHTDAFVVLLEPLAANMVGEAIISGVCQSQVSVGNESDTVCGADSGDTAKLKSGTGSNAILWKEPGTGVKWAIIRIGAGGGNGLKWRFAALGAELTQGGSCPATVYSGDPLTVESEPVTVHDWLLSTGQALSGGTHVIIMENENGLWYVTQAACA